MKTDFKRLYGAGGIFLLVAILSGCAGSESIVKATRPAGITMDSSMVIAVGDISGDQGKEFRADLRKALGGSAGLNLLKGQQESLTDSAYRALAAAQAEHRHALVVISGTYRMSKYDANKEEPGDGNSKREYIERTVAGRFSFRITDLTNNKLLLASRVTRYRSSREAPTQKSLLGNMVEKVIGSIIADPHEKEVREDVASGFIVELYPHDEVWNVKFLKDSEMPELETGISYANIGRWDESIEQFKNVIGKYPHHANLHKAYYDLGLAYKWNFMFPEARDNFEKAYVMKNVSEYYDEIQSLASFEEEYRTRQEQESPPK